VRRKIVRIIVVVLIILSREWFVYIERSVIIAIEIACAIIFFSLFISIANTGRGLEPLSNRERSEPQNKQTLQQHFKVK
jgi:hypothetical protein